MTAPDRFELYAFWRSSAAYRVRVALNVKGLEAHETFVDIDAGEQHAEAYRAVNPMGGIPAFVDRQGGGVPITQSLAILEYLEETHPAPALLPAGAAARARVRSLSALLAADTHPLVTPRVRQYLTTKGGFDPAAWRAWQEQWFGTGFRAIERRLSTEKDTGRFCHGDTPTVADICLASVIVVARVFKLEFDGLPTVSRIMAACEELDAFARADPRRQSGAPAQ
jgi:maleylacetoacetate isomerase/maleylpyruvate isomerase